MFAPAMLGSLLLAAVPVGPTAPASAPCPPASMTRADLAKLKQSKFEIASAEERNRLAPELLGCLDDSDPKVRDGVVFEALSTWLRGKALSPATILSLDASLRATLKGESDASGFRLPFAALILSEVARADRIEPLFTEAILGDLVDTAASSLARVSDYRGFDPVVGWRHGVAHGSDLVLQLVLNPRVGSDHLKRLMEAVGAQIAPRGPVFYTFGEPERLARAVVFAYRRGAVEPAFWDAWFASRSSAKPLVDWGSAHLSVEGLAKRHNTLAFLHALAYAGRAGGDEAGRTIAALADQAAALILTAS